MDLPQISRGALREGLDQSRSHILLISNLVFSASDSRSVSSRCSNQFSACGALAR